ncbi:DUF2635 domain-containing protein [Stutzerimonas balearica]|uniref:DUF2635 domain-containing protein n=1 Tax=Stutzerimonas balearica TaxID=74829 RepID=UPI001909B906|nr:DUF2635 domain-containing protein [Stutzerimonas balearica]MBK3748268.1 DUF2635 domain-containing protein [Stutzerimonas balearica]MBK3826465.1 DUF2635 domain-containing protein [Stutzerimonas balearica]MBK3856155.1 DUF2635 domain-containing protein [Stutzerimonas balearica]
MSQPVFLVPAEGLKVRHPLGGHLKPEGDFVVLDSYWHRRMADGSVATGTPPTRKRQAAPKE